MSKYMAVYEELFVKNLAHAGNRVKQVISVFAGMTVSKKTGPSCPRTRASRQRPESSAVKVYPWIPASAGMTVSKIPGRHARERGHPGSAP
ncbi:MAG: hypothetical protein GY862_35555, partial [Gammaproteobacteria bacterium]|nr:hypothetical protein [Gammaproteobacteria bacterium]